MDELRQIQEAIQGRLSELGQEETAIQARLLQIRQEKAEFQGAVDRFELFRSGRRERSIDDCMWCFVFDDYETKMTPIPSDRGDVDIFRCRQCKRTIEIKA